MAEKLKIAVTGFRGRVGDELISRGCIPLDCDITDIISIEKAFKEVRPDVIVNTAAYTKVDDVETDLVKAYKVNAIAPKILAKAFKGKIVHLSTDYIFKGDNPDGYSEVSIPNPMNSYGFSKFFGEISLDAEHRDNILIIRTTVLYTHKNIKDDFVRSVYRKLQRKEKVIAPKLYGNPTYVPHLSDGILKCIELDINGKLNVCGKEIITRLELAQRIAKTFDFDLGLISEGRNFGLAKRPTYYGMKTEKAQIMGIPIYSVDEGLLTFKENMSK